MRYLPFPEIQQINEREYKLVEDYFAILPNLQIIYIKEGFVFDGASIPKGLWGIVGSPLTGKYTRAAFIHDALYASELLPRNIADEFFIDYMVYCRVDKTKRELMYEAVNIFGGAVWKEHTKESVANARKFVSIEE